MRSFMKATIYHNPRCGTSRNTLAILEQTPGIELTIVEYLKDTPSAAELKRLYARAGITPAEGLRMREDGASALVNAPDGEVLAAMVANPILIQRPLVETDKGVRLCRPPERVRDIL